MNMFLGQVSGDINLMIQSDRPSLVTVLPEDVLKARVTTIGPEEHIIRAEGGSESSKKWTIYDVGGSRSQRGMRFLWVVNELWTSLTLLTASWAQFFDDGMLQLLLITNIQKPFNV